MKGSYVLAASIALSIGCAMAQPPLRDVASPAQPQILVGCDSASGRNSSEIPAIYGVIKPNLVRSQGVWWKTLEPTSGVYYWTTFDNMLAQNTVANFTWIAPDLAPYADASQPLLMFNVFQPPPFYTNSQSAYIAGECAFVQALLRHAPHAIQIIEFINEPGGGYEWVPQCTTWRQIATFTAQLAAAVRDAAHSVDPTVLIAGPSLSVSYDDNFFSVFAANGGFQACDIVTFHDYRMSGTFTNAPTYTAYQSGRGVTNLFACKADCEKWAPGKPVCVSELGLGTSENVTAYVTAAQRCGIWALCPTYFLGPSTNLWECGYWDSVHNRPKPNGKAFLDTMRAVNHSETVPTLPSAH